MSRLIDIHVWFADQNGKRTVYQGWAADCATQTDAARELANPGSFANLAYAHYLANALHLEEPPYDAIPNDLPCVIDDAGGTMAFEDGTLSWSLELR